jgi:tyrosyl-tRNA synthetase
VTLGLLDELRWRGMFQDATPGLEERLRADPAISGYIGFDPSGPSLHIGHLIPIFGLLHLQRSGGRPVAVVGGGTGMIGDPSGRSSERNLLDAATLEANVVAIRRQLEGLLDFEPGPSAARMVNNAEWLAPYGLIEFLRDVGKHFSIPYMLAKDSVQSRLERGLSFTEFSYMLLQAADFEHLHRVDGVELQMGGADQWGNITAGLELIRRVAGGAPTRPAYGLSYPLLLAPSGAKFGKTEGGDAVWLDPARTSPYAFYQHWLNADDRDVGTYLRWFTLLTRPEIEALEAAGASRPEARIPQRALARDITARIHGAAAADHAIAVSEAAFAREPIRDPAILATLHADVGGFAFDAADAAGDVLALTVRRGIFASNGEARRTISQGGLSINDRRVERPDEAVPQPIEGRWLVVRVGRKRLLIGRRED